MSTTTNSRPRVTSGVGRLVRRLEIERRRWARTEHPVVATEQAWRAGVAEGLRLAQLAIRKGGLTVMAINLGARDRVKTLPKVNRRALRKYGEFWRALQLVGDALAEADKVAAKATDSKTKRSGKGVSAKSGAQGEHWSTASPEEIRASAKTAHASLRVMASAAKKWEAELVSREWRK